MPKAIRFYQPGGPEVLVWEEVPVGKPGPGEARVRHTAVGLNYVDIYIRRGLYPVPLPSGLGTEAAGVVEAAKKTNLQLPVVLRLEGTNVQEGKKILMESGLNFVVAETMKDAADKVVAAARA